MTPVGNANRSCPPPFCEYLTIEASAKTKTKTNVADASHDAITRRQLHPTNDRSRVTSLQLDQKGESVVR